MRPDDRGGPWEEVPAEYYEQKQAMPYIPSVERTGK
jgi:hypothetical protein